MVSKVDFVIMKPHRRQRKYILARPSPSRSPEQRELVGGSLVFSARFLYTVQARYRTESEYEIELTASDSEQAQRHLR